MVWAALQTLDVALRYVVLRELATDLNTTKQVDPRSAQGRVHAAVVSLHHASDFLGAVPTQSADSAWDEDWAAELCLVNYGVPLVAKRKPTLLDVEYPLSPFASESISKFRGDGTLFSAGTECP